jgi:hypothetical protein
MSFLRNQSVSAPVQRPSNNPVAFDPVRASDLSQHTWIHTHLARNPTELTVSGGMLSSTFPSLPASEVGFVVPVVPKLPQNSAVEMQRKWS